MSTETTENTDFVERLRTLAEEGDPKAQNNLGVLYANEDPEVEVDFETAAMWWQRAAEQSNGSAAFNLAMSYLQGRGVEQDYFRAYDLLTEACAWIDEDDQDHLAMAFLNLGTTAILLGYLNDAMYAYNKAAELGDKRANLYLAMLTTESAERLNQEFWTKGKQDNPVTAQFLEGIFLLHGIRGYAKDPQLARQLIMEAGLKGSQQAADFYVKTFGIGPEADKTELENLERLTSVASTEIAGIIYSVLGARYNLGWGVEADFDKAIDMLDEGIKRGSMEALEYFLSIIQVAKMKGMNIDFESELSELIQNGWEALESKIDTMPFDEKNMSLFRFYAEVFKDGSYGFAPDYKLSYDLYNKAQQAWKAYREYCKTETYKLALQQLSRVQRLGALLGIVVQKHLIRKGLRQIKKLQRHEK